MTEYYVPSPGLKKILRSYHTWIIFLLVLFIASFYYSWQEFFPWFWRYFIFEYTNNIIGIPFIIIPFLYASIVFWWRGSALVWITYMVVLLPLLLYYFPINTAQLLRNVAFSFLPLAVVTIVAVELHWREKQKETMAEREKERQLYMAQIFKAQEDERRRIAQELHDDTTQELLVLANSAQDMAITAEAAMNTGLKERAERVRDMTLRISENVRRLSLDLRPSILDEIGLVPALRWLAERLSQDGSINTRVIVKGTTRKLSPETEVNIFRIIQEALSNTRKHSKATESRIVLHFRSDGLTIRIEDNGQGFSPVTSLKQLTSQGKLGIIGMQQRAKFINGKLDIISQQGEGTTILIHLQCPSSGKMGHF